MVSLKIYQEQLQATPEEVEPVRTLLYQVRANDVLSRKVDSYPCQTL